MDKIIYTKHNRVDTWPGRDPDQRTPGVDNTTESKKFYPTSKHRQMCGTDNILGYRVAYADSSGWEEVQELSRRHVLRP